MQKNGSPHFHLILLNVPYLAHQWVARSWYDVVGTGNPDHLDAGTETRRVQGFKAAFGYAAKYAGKVADGEGPETEGRVWGVIGRRDLPVRVLQWELDARGEARLTRAVRDLVDSRSRGAVPREHYPQWLIFDGRRAEALIAWAAGINS